jgi:hypothetical protein
MPNSQQNGLSNNRFTLSNQFRHQRLHWNGTGWGDRPVRTYRFPEARQTLDNMEARGVFGAMMRPVGR